MDGFKILSEFRFDIGNAVLNSEKLQGAVEKVGGAADKANISFQSFSQGLVGQFNLLNFSVFNILKSAMDITDNFQESTRSFAQMMAVNMNYLKGPIGTFNDKLTVSRNLMDEMIVRAGRIGISPTAMVQATTAISASLIPSGLAGKNLGSAQSLAGSGLQATRGLGMEAKDVGKDIASLITGSKEDIGGSLMSALIGSSKTFAQFKGNIEEFTELDAPERIKLLTKGLKELKEAVGSTGNEIVTLSDITDKMKDMVYGLGSILRPIGDVVFPIVMNAVKQFADKFQVLAPLISKQLGEILKDLAGNPKETMINLMSLRHVGSDFSLAKDIFAVAGMLDLLVLGLRKVGLLKRGLASIIMSSLGSGLMGIGKTFGSYLAGFFNLAGLMKIAGGIQSVTFALGWVFETLAFIIGKIFFPIAFLVTAFQTLHKAMDIVKVEKATAFANSMPLVLEQIKRMERGIFKLMSPFTDFIDVMSQLIANVILFISPANSWVSLMEMIADALDACGDGMVIFMAAMHGYMAGLIQWIGDISNLKFAGMGNRVKGAMNDSMDDYLNKHLKGVDNGKNLSNNITNIGSVVIKNDFKDNVEPDRIAYTMKDQLLKAAQNRTQSRGRSFQSSFAK